MQQIVKVKQDRFKQTILTITLNMNDVNTIKRQRLSD